MTERRKGWRLFGSIGAVATGALLATSLMTVPATAAPQAPQAAAATTATLINGYRNVGYFAQWGVYARDFQLKRLKDSGAAALTAHARSTGHLAGEGPVGRDDWADGLTDRELEVARLVVLGTTNREVATRLHLSVRTVEVHLARVFGKLDVHSRTELSYLVHGGSLRSTT